MVNDPIAETDGVRLLSAQISVRLFYAAKGACMRFSSFRITFSAVLMWALLMLGLILNVNIGAVQIPVS